MTIGQKIKALRKERGWSQDQLARLIKKDQHVISDWEIGKYKPSLNAIPKLLEVFNMTFEQFMEGVDLNDC